jgi:hypothetical protein
MEVTRAGVAAEPPNDDGATVEEVQQGCRLWHRRRTGRALGKARGRWSSWGSSASSRRQRWLDVMVLRGGDDGVVAGGDPGEVLRLLEEEREVRHQSNLAENREERHSP